MRLILGAVGPTNVTPTASTIEANVILTLKPHLGESRHLIGFTKETMKPYLNNHVVFEQ